MNLNRYKCINFVSYWWHLLVPYLSGCKSKQYSIRRRVRTVLSMPCLMAGARGSTPLRITAWSMYSVRRISTWITIATNKFLWMRVRLFRRLLKQSAGHFSNANHSKYTLLRVNIVMQFFRSYESHDISHAKETSCVVVKYRYFFCTYDS